MIALLRPRARVLTIRLAIAAGLGCVAALGSGCGSNHNGNSGGAGGGGANAGGGTAGGGASSGCPGAGVAIAGDIIDACGTIVPAAYRSMASRFGTAAGITYRYGSPAPKGDGQDPTWSQPPSTTIVRQDPNAPTWRWEVGGPEAGFNDMGLDDYSSNMGQAIYVADKGDDPGVSDLTTLLMGENTFSESPQLPWVYYGNGQPDVNVVDYQMTGALSLRQPTAIGRCHGNLGWCANSLMVFQSGLIATAGSNTARNHNVLQLPKNKVPTAISVTNNSEFALVTVWDTQASKGQVAVIALAGTCDGCELGKNMSYNWWGEWKDLYPGLRNLGNVGYMKLLGFVDLPEMAAPTEISASGDYMPSYDDQQGWMCSPAGDNCRTTPYDLTLSDETNRQSFIGTGPNAKRYVKSGFAAVISKSEKKVVFLDLKPLFAGFDAMYFGTKDDFDKTQDIGDGAGQWPYPFSHSPKLAPEVVKTVSFDDAPTSVATSMQTTNAAWVGTADGSIHVFTVGGYGSDLPAHPSDISEIGHVAVGKNPTGIAYAKHDFASPMATPNNEIIVVSRAERRIDWIRFDDTDAGKGTIVRKLTDSRLVDPISAEDADNHGTESYLLSIADYGGRQISQYRYGPVIFHTNPGAPGNSVPAACQPPDGCPMGGGGKDAFEFGGKFDLAGRPFGITAANVP